MKEVFSFQQKCSIPQKAKTNTYFLTSVFCLLILTTLFCGILTGGWLPKANVTTLLSGKNVKSGGCLAAVGDTIYALRGNNTRDMMVYSINNNNWLYKDSFPYLFTNKKVKKGGAICYDGGNWIYLLKGNNTKDFFKRGVAGESAGTWVRLADVYYPTDQGVKGGGALAYSDSTIYCFSGGKYSFFAEYDPIADMWGQHFFAPLGPDDKGFSDGSALTTDGFWIYALKGKAKVNEFYKFRPDSGWITLKELPLYNRINKKKKVKEGGALAYANGLIYALKGNNTLEFWVYNPIYNEWTQLEDMPSSNKRIKGGGSLTFAPSTGLLYAMKGNNTLEFYAYAPESTKLSVTSPKPADVHNYISKKNNILRLNIIPDPTQVINIRYTLPIKAIATAKLYNVLGKLVYTTKSDNCIIAVDKQLEAGIYILKFSAGGYEAIRKITITE